MGGSGSGRQAGWGLLVDKTTDYRSIDIDRLRRRGYLKPGYSGRITWSRNGTATGYIEYGTMARGLRLMYKTRRPGADWRDVDEIIPFANSRTNFAGQRRWFECPSCRRRCRIIYGGAYFRCRLCYRLRYESQYEPAFARAATKSHRLRERLGHFGPLDDPFPPKPKGMHWRTYERLRDEDARLQNAWAIGIAGRFGLFGDQ